MLNVTATTDIAPYTYTEHISRTETFDWDAWVRGDNTPCAAILVSHDQRRMVVVYYEGAPESIERSMLSRVEEMCNSPEGTTNQSFAVTINEGQDHQWLRRAHRCTVPECTKHMHWGEEPFHTHSSYDTKNAQIRIERFMNDPWKVNCEVSFDLSPREAKQIANRLATAADTAKSLNQWKVAA